jgi:competence protein ComEC
MATPTPQAGFRIYLPLIMKGWLTWLPGTPTLTPTPSATPTPTASATPTNTPTPTLTATPTPLPARLEIIFLICEGTDERFIITNSGGQAQVMTGWRIHSVEGDQWYPFPYAYTLAADATVRVHSGPTAFSNPPYDLFWTTAYIWNNKGDEAVLHDSTGQAVDNHCCSAGCHP